MEDVCSSSSIKKPVKPTRNRNRIPKPKHPWFMSGGSSNRPEPTFQYSDWDSPENELGEIYGYYEHDCILHAKIVFSEFLEGKLQKQEWRMLETKEERCNVIEDLLDDLEMVDELTHFRSIWVIAYLVQGCWSENETLQEQLVSIKDNVNLLLQCDAFWRIWKIFPAILQRTDSYEWDIFEIAAENCLSILCTITYLTPLTSNASEESIAETESVKSIYADFVAELKSQIVEENSILKVLFSAVCQIANRNPANYMLKKLLLLIRRVFLLTAGGFDKLRVLKEASRSAAGLRNMVDETLTTVQKSKLLHSHSFWGGINGLGNVAGTTLMSLEELSALVETEEHSTSSILNNENLRLLWTPKSSMADLKPLLEEMTHMENVGQKVPTPLKERVEKLTKYLYIPLGDFQRQQEQLLTENSELRKQESPCIPITEKIFDVLFPHHLFVKILQSMNTIFSKACPLTVLRISGFFVPRFCFRNLFREDHIRQAEIVMKSISIILILLLKHAKVNNIYQFEYIAKNLVSAGFLDTVDRLLKRDMECLPTAVRPDLFSDMLRNTEVPFKILNCDTNPSLFCNCYSWRYLFTLINLMRVVVKLVKSKPSRINICLTLCIHEALEIVLNIPNSFLQFYTLKVLKILWKYLEFEWKKYRTRIISAIFLKVRHKMFDQWLGCMSVHKGKLKSMYVDQVELWTNTEEDKLEQEVVSYVSRKDQDKVVVKSEEKEETKAIEDLSDDFKLNYEKWLHSEVYSKNIDWNSLISTSIPLI